MSVLPGLDAAPVRGMGRVAPGGPQDAGRRYSGPQTLAQAEVLERVRKVLPDTSMEVTRLSPPPAPVRQTDNTPATPPPPPPPTVEERIVVSDPPEPEALYVQQRADGPRVTPNFAVLAKFADRRELDKDARWSAGCPSCQKADALRITVTISGEIRLYCSNRCALPAILEAVNLHAEQLLPRNVVRSDRFAIVPVGELLAEPAEELRYVWHNTLPAGGLSILGAKPKVGKSTLARTLMLCVSRGEPFLGRGTRKGKVVYLSLEDKRSELQAALRKLGVVDNNLLVHTGRAPRESLTALREVIRTHQPVLVVIDTLQKLMRLEDLNDYAKVNNAMEELLDIARVSNTHIMVLHHFNKAATGGGDGLLGSTALFGAVDCLLEMHKRDDCRTVSSTQRYGEDLPEMIVQVEPHTGLVFAGEAMEQNRLARDSERVYDGLTEPATFDQLREKLAINRPVLQESLAELLREGRIMRSGAGRQGDPFLYSRAVTRHAA